MADFAASAPRPGAIEAHRANDNSASFDEATDLAASPLAAHGGQPRPDIPLDVPLDVPLGVDDMATGRLTPGAAIEAQRAHLAAVARDMDARGQQRNGRMAPRTFDRRFPVMTVLLGMAIVAAALVLF